MKVKVVLSLLMLNLLSVSAFAGSREYYESSSSIGKEGDENSLCTSVLESAGKLAACAKDDEQGIPKGVEVDKGCSSNFYPEHPGDNEMKVSVKANARWSCNLK